MDESIGKIVKKKSVPNNWRTCSPMLAENKGEESPRPDDNDDGWDHFVPVHSSRPNDNDEFSMDNEKNAFGSHHTHQHSSRNSTLLFAGSSSGRTPRTTSNGNPFTSLSSRKSDFSASFHRSSHSLEIIEDDKEFDLSRTTKGSLKSLGTFLSLVTMKAMPRIMFGVPKKIGIDGENMKVISSPILSDRYWK